MNYQTIRKYLVAMALTIAFVLSLGFGSKSSVQAEPAYSPTQRRIIVQNRQVQRRQEQRQRWILMQNRRARQRQEQRERWARQHRRHHRM